MRVLVVSNMYPNKQFPSYGIFVKRFCEELYTLNIQMDFSVMTHSKNKIDKLMKYISFFFRTFVKSLFGKYDVIYIHYASNSSIPVLAASRLKKLNLYVNVHGSDVIPENGKQVKMQKFTRKALLSSNKIIVPSEYFKEIVKQKYHTTAPIYIYPSGGVDPSLFYPFGSNKQREARKMFKVDNDKPTFGMACRIGERKGWDIFVEAISMLGEKAQQANFILVGSGPYDQKLSELITKYHLEDIIQRYPLLPQSKLAYFYNAITYFCSGSSRIGESLELVLLEAMACNKPVFTPDFAAPKYYVRENINGYKFKVDDVEGFSNAISKALDDYHTPKYSKLCQGAYDTSKEFFNTSAREKLKAIFYQL